MIAKAGFPRPARIRKLLPKFYATRNWRFQEKTLTLPEFEKKWTL